ncbi:hypothetical protein FIBSPDRAFT_1055435 [Athelia psychrophila]|uniref:Uncharacterized protein n=1 Tax=Athelia psychrophila TaxID=1759441 RepID=A0A167TQ79_9AGAM|nr:hypothetical protein FIBSPDRAFT_1055435 [Fibularhizoctonia sp. CBS 109695]
MQRARAHSPNHGAHAHGSPPPTASTPRRVTVTVPAPMDMYGLGPRLPRFLGPPRASRTRADAPLLSLQRAAHEHAARQSASEKVAEREIGLSGKNALNRPPALCPLGVALASSLRPQSAAKPRNSSLGHNPSRGDSRSRDPVDYHRQWAQPHNLLESPHDGLGGGEFFTAGQGERQGIHLSDEALFVAAQNECIISFMAQVHILITNTYIRTPATI